LHNQPKQRPVQAADMKSKWLREKEKPQQGLPAQKPVMAEDEVEEAPPSKWKAIFSKVLLYLFLMIAIVFVYIFLLLGEPEDDAQQLANVQEQKITTSMSPLEMPGESDVSTLATTFASRF